MEPLSDPKWETELAQELRKLPDREAPATLIPRVMAALQARVRLPWWRRTWWQWPPAAQLLGLLAVSSVLGLITYYATRGWEAALVAGMTQQVQAWLEPLRPCLELPRVPRQRLGAGIPPGGPTGVPGGGCLLAGGLCFLRRLGHGSVPGRRAAEFAETLTHAAGLLC